MALYLEHQCMLTIFSKAAAHPPDSVYVCAPISLFGNVLNILLITLFSRACLYTDDRDRTGQKSHTCRVK